jgi:hypothetical protein
MSEHTKGEIRIENDYVTWSKGSQSGKIHCNQAVKYLKHGAEMEETLMKVKSGILRGTDDFDYVFDLLNKLEGE